MNLTNHIFSSKILYQTNLTRLRMISNYIAATAE